MRELYESKVEERKAENKECKFWERGENVCHAEDACLFFIKRQQREIESDSN